ncbi:Cysteine-rich receptor-like protein kinase 25 [Bienertia sinuspersici]
MAKANMDQTTWPLLITLLITLITMVPKSSSQPIYLNSVCPNTTLFANNSQYHTNLNTLFNSLTTNAIANPDGFYSTSVNATTNDAVFGLFLCRGDQNTTTCRNCVTAATSDLSNLDCPNSKVGTTWYDECMVRYSNESFLGRMSETPRFRLMNTQNITGNMSHFMDAVTKMMDDVAVRASNGGPRRKFATAVAPYSSLQTMYGLGQCTPDLSGDDCKECLRSAIALLPVSLGARTVMASCNARYEVYPFFNGAANISQSPSPSPNTNSDPGLNPSGGRRNASTRLIIAIVVPIVSVAYGMIFVVGEDFTTVESLQYDLETLQSATNSFSDENKLGEGGFGGVYKGTKINGQDIAVKRLSKSSTQGIQEFKNEVLLVAKLQHRNLVRLLGFCLEREEKLLVYEYVPNKSLDSFLFGISRGMLYLHQDSQLTIIHRDLKTSNILLDADMNSKISDFGMAKIFGVDQIEGNASNIIGTYGYMSPEYAMHGQYSIKSDVYSFGVLALEIISGQRNSSFGEMSDADDLLSYAWKKWNSRVPLEFVDPTISNSYSSNEVLRCMHLGLLCVQESTEARPTMATVVLTLDSKTLTLPVPQQPAFFTKTKVEPCLAKVQGTDQSSSMSVNDVSITEVEPR